MLYKKGQLVKIKECKVGERYGKWFFYKEMAEYIGKTLKIVDVYEEFYLLEGNNWAWSDDMLEPVEEKELDGCPHCLSIDHPANKCPHPECKTKKPKECKHEWVFLKEIIDWDRTGSATTIHKFYCKFCLKIEYR